MVVAISLAAGTLSVVSAADDKKANPQQERMKACNSEAADKKGDERKAFMHPSSLSVGRRAAILEASGPGVKRPGSGNCLPARTVLAYTTAHAPAEERADGPRGGNMRTLTLLLTATLLVVAGTLAVVEPGFNIVPVSTLKCETPDRIDSAVCLDEQHNPQPADRLLETR